MSLYDSFSAMSAVVEPPASASFTYPSSVGPETASVAVSALISTCVVVAPDSESTCAGVTKPVICTGNEINRNTRPTNAGLNGLQPRPPNDILPTPIATSAPMTIIQTGSVLGRLKPSSTPVTTAE